MSESENVVDANAPSTASKPSDSATSETYEELYLRRFLNRLSPVMRAKRGRWYCEQTRLNPHLLHQAIHGLTTLGLYAVSTTGTSKWAVLDADTEPDSKKLLALVDRLVAAGQADHLLLEVSRRGYHLFAFFRPPIDWQSAGAYGEALARSVDLECETFPKGPGLNGIKAPGSRHPLDGRVYPILNLTTWAPEHDVPQLLSLIQPLSSPAITIEPERVLERRDPVSGLHQLEPLSRSEQHAELVAEVTKYTALKYIGPERLQGRCPFHRPDRHPSFGITNAYWCCFAQCLGEGRSHGGINAFRARMREKGLL